MSGAERTEPGSSRLGFSGALARRFLTSQITPLLALVGVLLGGFAVIVTPREEEPQIAVTFANVFIPFPGASAKEVEQLVTTPAEQVLSEIVGVEHLYSASMPGMAIITVRYYVGVPRLEAIMRLYNALHSNQDWIPPGVGVGPFVVKPKGIDDVPVFAATLWTRDPTLSAEDLSRVAHAAAVELQRVPGTRDVELIGAPQRVVRVQFDPQRLVAYGLALEDLRSALDASNRALPAGSRVADNREVLIDAGRFLSTPDEVAELVVGLHDGAPVFLHQVATVSAGPEQPQRYVSYASTALGEAPSGGRQPAVTLSVSKKPGENAVMVTRALRARLQEMQGSLLPEQVSVTVTRDYGVTAEEKAQTLIKKLMFATLSVVVLVLFTLGWREAVVVGAAVGVTLAITLFASWAWGFTLNRVSLFALIFSIGILVDDAIVVVENIHRHMSLGGRSLTEAIPHAVEEVGGPTILATFTVIAALLPMAFVSGLMGPYMQPIPINASLGMIISLAVAFIFTPWLYRQLFLRHAHADGPGDGPEPGFLQRFFERVMTPMLRGAAGKRARLGLLALLLALIAGSMLLPVVGAVVLKMLPLDNKSEFQVLVDMPEGTPLEQTHRVLQALADHIETVPEVTDYQIHAGTAAPINFNGLVRQYELRRAPHQGDLQVNLVDKQHRDRKSHDIALAVRPPLAAIGREYGASVSVVEVPPGPPVMAPLVAEVYGINDDRRRAVAREVRRVFEATEHVVDIDDSIEAPQTRWVVDVDRARAAKLGVSQASVMATVAAAYGGEDASYLHDPNAQRPVPIRLELSAADQADPAVLGSMSVRSMNGALVPIGEVARVIETTRDRSIQHKDLLPVTYVTGDVAGGADSPLYGMFPIWSQLSKMTVDGDAKLQQTFISQPVQPVTWGLKWDGEWQVTYETFRDMGIAYVVGLIVIYLLVVAQFRSYGTPLIIMAPIPLTLIGIMPGHAVIGQLFTAPSMIGMIALAGIIVRNSILLVDFIQLQVAQGRNLQDATIRAAAVRAKPIVLTGVAAMTGGFFILDDPMFGGLAVSLIFGILVSTMLTLVVIPVVYYAYNYRQADAAAAAR